MIIKNISILSFKNMAIHKNMDLLINDGKIEKITESSESDKPVSFQPGEFIIDGTGKYIIPGLVNAHAHTAMSLLRGVAEDVTESDWFNKHVWIYEQNLIPDDVYTGTLIGAAEMLLSGVTTVADHYFAMDRAFDAYMKSGMRANLAWAVFGIGSDSEKQFETAMDFTRKYKGKNSRISISLGPHSPYICPEDFLKKIVVESEKLNLQMHIHVSETHNPKTGLISDILPLLNSGELVGLKDYGEIKEGALADLVIIDPSTPNMMPGNNIFADILYSLNNRNVDSVIVDGKLIVENGKLLTINVKELQAEAAEISKRLVATVSDKPMQHY